MLHSYFHILQLFQLSGKVLVFVYHFVFCYFLWSAGTAKFIWWQGNFFMLINFWSGLLIGMADPFSYVWSSGRDWLIHFPMSGLLGGIGWSIFLSLVFWSGLADQFSYVWPSGRDWLIHFTISDRLARIGWFTFLCLAFWPGSADQFSYVWSFGRDWLIHFTMSDRLARIGWSVCISKFQRILCVSFSRILVCADTICRHGQILVSCTIPTWSLFPPNHVYSNILFVPVCRIRLLCDSLSHFCHHITYTCYSSVYDQFLLWHNHFVLLLKYILLNCTQYLFIYLK